MDRAILSQEELQAGLKTISPEWSAGETALTRSVEFPSFLLATRFVAEMAPVAERLEHHPDLRLSWRTLELTLTTHWAGGITALDLALASELDPIIARLTGSEA
jgi:4a-hydroxytetrahydrobiopterin dehydratase